MDKIDVVYLWVDGADKKWRAAKDKWLTKLGGDKLWPGRLLVMNGIVIMVN